MTVVSEFAVRCSMWSDIQQHLPRLYEEAAVGDAQVIELGVRSGNSTAAFLAAVEVHGGHVWSVDTVWPPVPWHGRPEWTFIEGDDLTVVDQLPDGVDVLFIDTIHHYRHTLAELELYVPKVKAGGVVLLHDVELEWPDGTPVGDPAFPVRVAVEEFCAGHDLTPEFVSGCYGLGVLRIEGG